MVELRALQTNRRAGWLALALICVVLGGLWPRQRLMRLDEFDQPFYLGIAYDLVHDGRFTDGYRFAEPAADGLRPSGMRFAPLYPSLLATVSAADGGLRGGMDCLVRSGGKDTGCAVAAPVMRGLQLAQLACVFWLVWWMGGAIGGSVLVAWSSLGLALMTAPLLLGSAGALMTEMSCLLFTTAATASAIRMWRSPNAAGWAALSGLLVGFAALTRPAFLYLLPACWLGLAVVVALSRGTHRNVVQSLMFVLASVVAPACWVVRNAIVMHRAALTYGYDSHTLVQRIAFDTMTWREYGLAYLCWLPDGTALGQHLVGPHACDRFGWDEQPNSFYTLGLRHMLDETLAASGGYEHHLGYLMHTYILHMPLTHLMVAVPLALRGAYVDHWWGFALLVPALLWTVAGMRGRPPETNGDKLGFLTLALPAWFMLAFNASVAVNQVRYNLMLMPVYSVAGALSIAWVYRWHVARRDRRKGI